MWRYVCLSVLCFTVVAGKGDIELDCSLDSQNCKLSDDGKQMTYSCQEQIGLYYLAPNTTNRAKHLLNLWKQKLPKSVTHLTVTGCSNLTINFKKTEDTASLQTLLVEEINNLLILCEADCFLPNNLHINIIDKLEIQSKNDGWKKTEELELLQLERLYIEELNEGMLPPYNNISFKNVRIDKLERHALKMDNVNIDITKSFMQNVSSNSVRLKRCNVSLTSNSLGFISPGGISIEARNITIKGNVFINNTHIVLVKTLPKSSNAHILITLHNNEEGIFEFKSNSFLQSLTLHSQVEVKLLENRIEAKLHIETTANLYLFKNFFRVIREDGFNVTSQDQITLERNVFDKISTNGAVVNAAKVDFIGNRIDYRLEKQGLTLHCKKVKIFENAFHDMEGGSVSTNADELVVAGNAFTRIESDFLHTKTRNLLLENNTFNEISDKQSKSSYHQMNFSQNYFTGDYYDIKAPGSVLLFNKNIFHSDDVIQKRPQSINIAAHQVNLVNNTYKNFKVFLTINSNVSNIDHCRFPGALVLKVNSTKSIFKSNEIDLLQRQEVKGINVSYHKNSFKSIRFSSVAADDVSFVANTVQNVQNSVNIMASGNIVVESNNFTDIKDYGINIKSQTIHLTNNNFSNSDANSFQVSSNDIIAVGNVLEATGFNLTSDRLTMKSNLISKLQEYGLQIVATDGIIIANIFDHIPKFSIDLEGVNGKGVLRFQENKVGDVTYSGIRANIDTLEVYGNTFDTISTDAVQIIANTTSLTNNVVKKLRPSALQITSPVINISGNTFQQFFQGAIRNVIPGRWSDKSNKFIDKSMFNFSNNVFELLTDNSFILNSEAHSYKFQELDIRGNKFQCTCNSKDFFNNLKNSDDSLQQRRIHKEFLKEKNKNVCMSGCSINQAVRYIDQICEIDICDQNAQSKPRLETNVVSSRFTSHNDTDLNGFLQEQLELAHQNLELNSRFLETIQEINKKIEDNEDPVWFGAVFGLIAVLLAVIVVVNIISLLQNRKKRFEIPAEELRRLKI